MDYCIAIRTLGKAGQKYQRLLDSISVQTIQPQNVIVYIPYDYDLPREKLGWEKYVRCEKGMVTQRSLPFYEVNTEYCLFCDDDISFPNDFVEKLLSELNLYHGDCISPDVYHHHKDPFFIKALNCLMWANPRKTDEWAFKINRYTSGYSYNNSPRIQTLCSQSAAFACFLCKMDVFRKIHFEDERWVDTIPYGSGDDQLFYYKLYLMKFRLLVCYDTGIKHLDASSSRKGDKETRFKQHIFMRYCLWYRTCYSLTNQNNVDRLLSIILFGIKIFIIYLYHIIWSILNMRWFRIRAFLMGLFDGYRYVHSPQYLKFPAFDSHISFK